MTETALEEGSARFASDIQSTLDGTLPGTRQVVSIKAEHSNRFVVTLDGGRMDLYVDGVTLAHLSFSMDQELDRTGQYLKTTGSKATVWSSIDRRPLLRLEYKRDMHTDPICHWQIHAERGAMSHLLGRANFKAPDRVRKPHDFSTLHFPVGGERYRPCLEDVLQFLITDCGVDYLPGWEQKVIKGRERWRRLQLRSSVRDIPHDAAQVLRTLGWTVAPPPGDAVENLDPLRTW